VATLGVAYHPLETLEERARTLAELSVILAEVGSDHVVIGGIAVGYHGRLRATVNVDLLVPRAKLEDLAHALRARDYVVAHTQDMVRVYPPAADPDHAEAIADLVAREANPVLEAAARVAEQAKVLGHQVRIVPRGALFALKFHAAISQRRGIEDRYQDVADIGRIIKKRFEPGDEQLALQIAAHAYPGAEAELGKLIDDLRHGRPVKIERLGPEDPSRP
jgi:hypothetical protein